MPQYEIIRITDHNDRDKTDEASLSRIGRIVNFDEYSIGSPLFLRCTKPGFEKSIITSDLFDIVKEYGVLYIVTRNSVYVLEEIYGT